jgi:hypothetical protein
MNNSRKLLLGSLFFLASSLSYGYDPLDCVKDIAQVDPEINVGLATRLCSGSWTSEPVKCYRNVSQVDKEINRGIAIDLCSGTINADKTIKCYAKAASQFNRGIATTLCGAKKQEK